MSQDLYARLGVSRNADQDEIKKAFRKLSLNHHPDKGGDEETFKKINEAYDVLSDPDRRQMYDQTGSVDGEMPDGMMGGGFPFDMGGLGGLFGMFGGGGPFGAMGGGPRAGGARVRREKGPVTVHEVPLVLADFYNGKQLHVEFDRQKFCTDCKGEGFTSFQTCDTCGGNGHVTRMGMIGPGMAVQMNGPCTDCQALGKKGANSCGKCKGKKFLTQAKTLDVKIEPGMKAGDILVFPNECSDNHEFVTPGDVHFILQEADEETIWKRDGNHLRATIDIHLEQSLLGTKKTLKGHPGFVDGFEVVVPVGTQNQEVLRIPGGGMPLRGSTEKGDALITVRLVVTPKEREILEKNKLIFSSMFL